MSSQVSYLKVVDWMMGIWRGSPFFGVYPPCTHRVPRPFFRMVIASLVL